MDDLFVQPNKSKSQCLTEKKQEEQLLLFYIWIKMSVMYIKKALNSMFYFICFFGLFVVIDLLYVNTSVSFNKISR